MVRNPDEGEVDKEASIWSNSPSYSPVPSYHQNKPLANPAIIDAYLGDVLNQIEVVRIEYEAPIQARATMIQVILAALNTAI